MLNGLKKKWIDLLLDWKNLSNLCNTFGSDIINQGKSGVIEVVTDLFKEVDSKIANFNSAIESYASRITIIDTIYKTLENKLTDLKAKAVDLHGKIVSNINVTIPFTKYT